jgi:hypothetical protein
MNMCLLKYNKIPMMTIAAALVTNTRTKYKV